MEYTVFYQGAEIGQAVVEPEGLYYRLSASAAEPGPGVWRLWGCFGAESRCLGVLFPGEGGLRLERRVSRHSWAILPEAFVLGREAEGFRPWRGVLEGQEVPDAMLRTEGGRLTLALFAPPEGPVPFAERTDQMREGELGGRSCLLLDWPPEELKVEN
ncbi:MAG: hypothetical protein IKQ04_07065 [Oscillospiraceae bacterium]|nr:hypothetical protein [Oscillospiraceae bacterium]